MKRRILTALLLCVALCLPALSLADEGETGKTMLDIVWLIDTTGTMQKLGAVEMIKSQMTEFAAELEEFDVQYGLAAFGDKTYNEETKRVRMSDGYWTSNLDILKSYMTYGDNALPQYQGGSDFAESSTEAIIDVTEYDWRENALRHIILVTDAPPKTADMKEAIKQCVTENVTVSYASIKKDPYSYYDELLRDTGGFKKLISNEEGCEISGIAKNIRIKTLLNAQPAEFIQEIGKVATFTVAGLSTKSSYKWQKWNIGGVSWSARPNETASTLTLNPVGERDAGKYRCIVSDSDTTYYSDIVTLTVVYAPAITTQPASQTVDAGKDVSFAIEADGYELSYQWQKMVDGIWTSISDEKGVVSGATSATLQLSSAKESDIGEYRCVVTSGVGTELNSSTVTLTVFGIKTQPEQSKTVEAGATVSFTVAASGDVAGYQWQKESGSGYVNISGETSATLKLSNVKESDAGLYRCVVSSWRDTTDTSDAAALTVYSAPAISASPKDVFTEAGKDAVFSAAATGEGMTYQWQEEVNGVWTPIAGETGDTLTVTATPEKNGRRYRCVATSSFGTETTSQPATLTVADAPAITAQPQSLRAEVGEGAEFTVEATGYELHYQWQVLADGVWTDCPNGRAKTLTLSALKRTDDGSVYRCRVTSGFGTELISDEVTLTVVALPDLPETGDSSRLWLWAALCAACMLGIAALKRRA